MGDIFISHVGEDSAIALEIALALEEAGALSATPNGRIAVSIGSDSIRIWNLELGVCLGTLCDSASPAYFLGGNAVCVAPDGQRAVTNSPRHGLQVWDVPATRTLRTMRRYPFRVAIMLPVSMSPDGRLVLSAHGHSATLWDVVTGERLRAFKERDSLSLRFALRRSPGWPS